MKHLVSILIPAFNAQEWIAHTIQSALAQTWPRREIIVVDDGSRDDTLSIARRFASRDVLVVTQPNQGASAARNTAMSLCQGEFLQWLDADDLLAPDKLERQMKAVSRIPGTRTLLSSAWGNFFYRPSRARFSATPLWCDLPPAEWLVRKLRHNLFMQTATWLVSRDLTAAAGPWDTRLSYDDDGEYFSRVLLKSDGIRFIPDAYVMYRMSGPQRLSYIGQSDAKLESFLLSIRLHIDYLWSLEKSERVRAACLEFLRCNLIYFYPQRPDLVAQLKHLASTLEGNLDVPQLRWKYAWIQKAFGWHAAKNIQMLMPGIRWSIVKRWDKTLAHLARQLALCP